MRGAKPPPWRRRFWSGALLASCAGLAGAAVGIATSTATVVSPENIAPPTIHQLLDRFVPARPLATNVQGSGAVQVRLPALAPGAPAGVPGGSPGTGGVPAATATGPGGTLAPTEVGTSESGGSQPVRNPDGSVSINLTGTSVARAITRMPDGQLLVDFN